jgi:hypothetical protein
MAHRSGVLEELVEQARGPACARYRRLRARHTSIRCPAPGLFGKAFQRPPVPVGPSPPQITRAGWFATASLPVAAWKTGHRPRRPERLRLRAPASCCRTPTVGRIDLAASCPVPDQVDPRRRDQVTRHRMRCFGMTEAIGSRQG